MDAERADDPRGLTINGYALRVSCRVHRDANREDFEGLDLRYHLRQFGLVLVEMSMRIDVHTYL